MIGGEEDGKTPLLRTDNSAGPEQSTIRVELEPEVELKQSSSSTEPESKTLPQGSRPHGPIWRARQPMVRPFSAKVSGAKVSDCCNRACRGNIVEPVFRCAGATRWFCVLRGTNRLLGTVPMASSHSASYPQSAQYCARVSFGGRACC